MKPWQVGTLTACYFVCVRLLFHYDAPEVLIESVLILGILFATTTSLLSYIQARHDRNLTVLRAFRYCIALAAGLCTISIMGIFYEVKIEWPSGRTLPRIDVFDLRHDPNPSWESVALACIGVAFVVCGYFLIRLVPPPLSEPLTAIWPGDPCWVDCRTRRRWLEHLIDRTIRKTSGNNQATVQTLLKSCILDRVPVRSVLAGAACGRNEAKRLLLSALSILRGEAEEIAVSLPVSIPPFFQILEEIKGYQIR